MSAGQCDSTTTVADLVIRCEREHGHGGVHRAEIDDMERDPNYTYVVSWWPRAAQEQP